MIKVYDASNTIEANLLKGILEQEGIEVVINGEYLQGAIGELPTMGMIQILVEETDQQRAEDIIQEWERGSYSLPDELKDN